MDYDFIDNLRVTLESTNIFKYSIKGAKMCAVLLLFFGILERWGKNVLNQNSALSDALTIIGYVFLIMSSDFIFDTVEDVFAGIDDQMNAVDDTIYTDLLAILNAKLDIYIDSAEGGLESISLFFTHFPFFLGYGFCSILMAICKIAEMSVIVGYLLSRLFLLEVMKFLFPIAVALSTIKATSGLIGKWLKLYIGISILGIFYIGIIKMCSLTQSALQKEFATGSLGMFDDFFSLNTSVWGALIGIIIVFTLKVSLFNKVTSFTMSFFN